MAVRLVLLALTLSAVVVQAATAAAPQQRSQAPGFYRMMLGDFEVTALSDGSHPFPVATALTGSGAGPAPSGAPRPLLSKSRPGETEALLAESRLGASVEGSINAFLINTGQMLILIDAGAGALYGPCCGRVVGSLEAAGYRPEQVDLVLLTHLHEDHVGGIMKDGRAVFPNAIVRSARTDMTYWTDPKAKQAAPDFLKPFFDAAVAAIAPYVEAKRFQPFDAGQEIAPGVKAIAAPGHTPGHSFIQIESKGEKLLAWGDVVHVAPVQFPDPSVTVRYDADEHGAELTREEIFADAARQGYWIAAAHISFPGLGHVQAKGGSFSWIPANYSSDPTRR